MSLVILAIESVWLFAALMLIQSTLLVAGVYFTVKLLRLRDAALLSLIYRSALLATLVSPLVTFVMLQSDISGWWPQQWSERPIVAMDAPPLSSLPAEEPESMFTLQPQLVPLASQDSLDSMPDSINKEIAQTSGVLPTFPGPSKPSTGNVRATDVMFFAKFTVLFTWGCISSLLLLRLWRTHTQLWRILSKAVPVEHAVQAYCDRLARDMKVTPPRVVCSPYFTSPFLAGIARPVVHLSCDGADDQRESAHPAELRDILVHELAHLKRCDVWMRHLNHFVLAIFFFHPLLRWLNKWIEDSAEDVCDDYAMTFGARRDQYAGQLVDLAERCDFPLGPAVGIASGKSMLAHRVTRILDRSRKLSISVSRTILALCGILMMFAVAGVCLLMTPTNHAVADPPKEAAVASEVIQQLQSMTQASPEAVLPKEATVAPEFTPQSPMQLKTMPPTPRGKVQSKDEWPQDIVKGTVVGESGPIAGAEVYWWRSRVHDMEPMRPVRVVTDTYGKFELKRTAPNANDPAIWDMREEMLIRAPGYGFERTWPAKFGATVPFDPDFPQRPVQLPDAGEPLKLVAEGPPISGKLVDIEGQPIEGASVRIRWFSQRRKVPEMNSPRSILGGLLVGTVPPERTEADWIAEVFSVVQSIAQVPFRDALPMATTDREGKFQLTGLPRDSIFKLLVERKGIQSTDIVVRNYEGDKVITVPQKEGYTSSPPTTLYPEKFQTIIGPSLALVGTVTDAETGKPIPGAMIRTDIVAGTNLRSSRDLQHLAARTDEQGRYRIDGLPIGKENNVEVFTTGDVAYMPVSSEANTSAADALSAGQKTLDFQLKKGVWAEGRVYDPNTDEPFQGEISSYWFRNRELEATYPGIKRVSLDGRYFTDSDGRYRIPVLPTPGVIAFSTLNRDHKRMSVYSRGYGESELAQYRNPQGNFPYYETMPHYLIPGNYNRLALIEPQPNEQVVKRDMPLSASKPIPVLILNPDGTPNTAQIEVYGGNERWGWENKSAKDFHVEDLLANQKRKVFAFDRQRNLVGGTIVEHAEGKKFEIQLTLAGKVHGRLFDADGAPITDATLAPDGQLDDLQLGVWANELGKQSNPILLTIDKEGRFEVHGLWPDCKYSAWVNQEKKGISLYIGKAFENLQIEPGETRDLGDIVVKQK